MKAGNIASPEFANRSRSSRPSASLPDRRFVNSTLDVGRSALDVHRMSQKAQLVAEGKKLAVSNLDKVLYPKVGFTKGQVIDYYIRIAPVLLPHLKDRPLTMKRYPNGVEAE